MLEAAPPRPVSCKATTLGGLRRGCATPDDAARTRLWRLTGGIVVALFDFRALPLQPLPEREGADDCDDQDGDGYEHGDVMTQDLRPVKGWCVLTRARGDVLAGALSSAEQDADRDRGGYLQGVFCLADCPVGVDAYG